MSTPPFILFSARREPVNALQSLEAQLPNALVIREGPNWKEAAGTWKRGLLKPPLTLRVVHDPDYYTSASFAAQRNGMANYLRGFPGAEERPELFDYLNDIQFALSFQFQPQLQPDDPRLDVLLKVTALLDGIVFLPDAVLDSKGLTIIAADGKMHSGAQIPTGPSRESQMPAGKEGPEESDDEEVPRNPPSAKRVAQRMQVLLAGAVRGFVEQAQGDTEGRQRYVNGLVAALQNSSAWSEAEPDEVRRLQTPIGILLDRDLDYDVAV